MKNKLPEGWKDVTVGEVAEVFNGKTPSELEKRKEGHPILKIKDITEDGYFKGSFDSFVDSEFFNKYDNKIIKKGDTLILNAAHNAEYVGSKTFYVKEFPNGVISTGEWLIVRAKPNCLDTKFKHFLMTSPLIRNKIKDKVKGIHLYPKDVRDIKINLPPLHTQHKIVSILEPAEQVKEWRKEADELTKEFLKAVFMEMFGNPSNNPKKWKMMRFDEVGELARGKSKHRPRNAPELLGGKYPLIQTGEVANSKGYILNYTQTYSDIGLKQSKMWPKGTLCITIAANIALTGILTFDACFPDSIVGFKPNNETRTEYVQYWLSFLQKTLEDSAPESAQKNINIKILSDLKIPVPPIELQNEFSSIVKEVESMKEQQKHSKVQLDNLFNVLMQKAFRGELVV